MIENGKVVVSQPDGDKRQALASSRLLGGSEARELLDWRNLRSKDSSRLLLTVGEPPPSRDLHTPVGGELWQVDTDGAERFVSADVFQAKLSPDGERLLYATSLRSVVVQAGDGRVLLAVTQGYDPNWKPDGSSIVLSRTDERYDLNHPERLHVSTIDIETGRARNLTKGTDDSRPEFHPSGRWVVFVSGARTGLASFWRVAVDGGDATQLTNVGATVVDKRFVPTPFKRTLWSSDGRWFLYDFKLGDREEVWGLEFGPSGNVVRARKIALGLEPRWIDDGVSVAVQEKVDGRSKLTFVRLPR
ncbi:MAG: hypothetical protein WC655_27875 [Candidatus Hydrogenedentales bacterium]